MTNSTEKQEVCMTFGKIFTESSLIFLQLHGQQINVEKPKVKDFYWILDKQNTLSLPTMQMKWKSIFAIEISQWQAFVKSVIEISRDKGKVISCYISV